MIELTDEDRAAINAAMRKLFPHMAAEGYEWNLSIKEERIYLAGLRSGLERAAVAGEDATFPTFCFQWPAFSRRRLCRRYPRTGRAHSMSNRK